MTSPSPSKTVFSIPELLESILLNLDPHTLLTTAQSTCTPWTTLIRSSPRLQQALFLLPAPTGPKAYNPLLAKVFPALFPAPIPNPALEDGDRDGDGDGDRDHDSAGSLFTFSKLDMVASPAKMAAYRRPEASWRRMLLQQPPVSEMGFVGIRSAMGGQSYSQFKILPGSKDGGGKGETESQSEEQSQDLGGLRMRHLFGWLIFGRRANTSIRVFWTGHTEVQIPKGRRNPYLSVAYERMVQQFEVVIEERVTVRCVRGTPRPIGENERLMMELRELYGGVEGEDEFAVAEVDITASILEGYVRDTGSDSDRSEDA